MSKAESVDGTYLWQGEVYPVWIMIIVQHKNKFFGLRYNGESVLTNPWDQTILDDKRYWLKV